VTLRAFLENKEQIERPSSQLVDSFICNLELVSQFKAMLDTPINELIVQAKKTP